MAGVKGRSGRPPKPTALHVIQGTLRKDRHKDGRAGEPKASGDGRLPPPPATLSLEERREWKEVAATLKYRIFSEEDVYAFRSFIQMQVLHRQLYRHIEENGIKNTFTNKHGGTSETLTPEVRQWSDLCTKLLTYYARFGMTPADRARVREIGDKDGHQENPDDEFGA